MFNCDKCLKQRKVPLTVRTKLKYTLENKIKSGLGLTKFQNTSWGFICSNYSLRWVKWLRKRRCKTMKNLKYSPRKNIIAQNDEIKGKIFASKNAVLSWEWQAEHLEIIIVCHDYKKDLWSDNCLCQSIIANGILFKVDDMVITPCLVQPTSRSLCVLWSQRVFYLIFFPILRFHWFRFFSTSFNILPRHRRL